MPTIAETAAQLLNDGQPVLLIDTCTLLDIIRAPLREIPDCIKSALELVKMCDESRCRIVAASLVQDEWTKYEQKTKEELEVYLKKLDHQALQFHDACEHLGLSLSFLKPSYQEAGLATRLHALSADLLKKAIHLSPSEEAKSKAFDRTMSRIPPSKKGGGLEDCVIVEEYLELCRKLHVGGFTKKRGFCSSNTNDYHDGRKLHESLKNEFEPLGLLFDHVLSGAVNKLK